MWEPIFAGVVFGVLASLGLRLSVAACKDIIPFVDGPQQGTPPAVALIVGSALLGMFLCYRGAAWGELMAIGILDLCLVAAWAGDVLCGIIPDSFTVLPLLAAVTLRIVLHQWGFVVDGFILFMPFAVVAALSKGRGMGWGDVKLAALGGVVLGMYLAMVSFSAACVIALIVALWKGRRNDPIAFGPYLAGAIGIAVATEVPGAM